MSQDLTAEEETRRRFAAQIDAINLRAQIEGRDPDAATDLAAIMAEHEAACANLKRAREEAERGARAP